MSWIPGDDHIDGKSRVTVSVVRTLKNPHFSIRVIVYRENFNQVKRLSCIEKIDEKNQQEAHGPHHSPEKKTYE